MKMEWREVRNFGESFKIQELIDILIDVFDNAVHAIDVHIATLERDLRHCKSASGTALRSFWLRVDDQLGAAKYRESTPAVFVRDYGVPYLGGLAAMHRSCNSSYRPFARGAQMIGLEFDRGKAGGPRRQIGHATVP